MIDPHGGPMSTMHVIQVPRPNAPFELVERPIPDPPAGSVRIRVQACGLCHSDSLTKSGSMPGIVYPRVPGHNDAGAIDAIEEGVTWWSEGSHVRVGWHARLPPARGGSPPGTRSRPSLVALRLRCADGG